MTSSMYVRTHRKWSQTSSLRHKVSKMPSMVSMVPCRYLPSMARK